MTADPAQQREYIARLTKHYTGGDDPAALLKTNEYQALFQKFYAATQDEKKANAMALKAMGKVKTSNVTINGFFLGNAGKPDDRKARVWTQSGVVVVPGEFQAKAMATVRLDGLTFIRDLEHDSTYYQASGATITAFVHKDPKPDAPLGPVLAKLRAWRDDKSNRWNKTHKDYPALVTGRIINEDGCRIWINDDRKTVEFTVEDSAGVRAKAEASFDIIAEKTNVAPQDEPDALKTLLAGRNFVTVCSANALTNLPDERAPNFQQAITTGWHNNTSIGAKNKKKYLSQAFEAVGVNGDRLWIYGLEESRDGSGGIYVKVDCADAKRLPTLEIGARHVTKGDESWTFNEGTDFWLEEGGQAAEEEDALFALVRGQQTLNV